MYRFDSFLRANPQPSRLVLKGEQIVDLQKVVARSVYADPAHGGPGTDAERYRLQALVRAIQGLPAEDPREVEIQRLRAQLHETQALADSITQDESDPYEDEPAF